MIEQKIASQVDWSPFPPINRRPAAAEARIVWEVSSPCYSSRQALTECFSVWRQRDDNLSRGRSTYLTWRRCGCNSTRNLANYKQSAKVSPNIAESHASHHKFLGSSDQGTFKGCASLEDRSTNYKRRNRNKSSKQPARWHQQGFLFLHRQASR